MSEFWLMRAMQTACLDKSQIERIHAVEQRVGHCLANFNIQDILGIDSVKDRWGIPEDDVEAQARHADRIRTLMKAKGFLKNDLNEFPGETNFEAMHCMDWTIFNRGAEIIWEYSSNKTGRGLRKSLVKEVALLFILLLGGH